MDVSQDYSTDAFLQVLRRFSSLRGWPKKIFSDSGMQLVAGSKELCSVVKGLDWELLQKYAVSMVQNDSSLCQMYPGTKAQPNHS